MLAYCDKKHHVRYYLYTTTGKRTRITVTLFYRAAMPVAVPVTINLNKYANCCCVAACDDMAAAAAAAAASKHI